MKELLVREIDEIDRMVTEHIEALHRLMARRREVVAQLSESEEIE